MQLIVSIIGPTASGKTSFGIALAQDLDAEIICVDSTTVYRGFDIGSGKPTAEEQKKAVHHLIDVLNPDEEFSAGDFVRRAEEAMNDCLKRGKLPILVGGSYFYLKALQHGMYDTPEITPQKIEMIEKEFDEEDATSGQRMHHFLSTLDPVSAGSIHPNDRYRLVRAIAILKFTDKLPSELKPVQKAENNRYWLKYAIGLSRRTLNQSIQKRTESMLTGGLVEETRALAEKHPDSRALQSIGYREVMGFLKKEITEKQLRSEIIEKTRQLAKRQVTWLRSDPEVRYVDFNDLERVKLEISNLKYLFAKEN